MEGIAAKKGSEGYQGAVIVTLHVEHYDARVRTSVICEAIEIREVCTRPVKHKDMTRGELSVQAPQE